jgi:hypothetical protein
MDLEEADELLHLPTDEADERMLVLKSRSIQSDPHRPRRKPCSAATERPSATIPQICRAG